MSEATQNLNGGAVLTPLLQDKKIAVLAGGYANERDVSLESGKAVLSALSSRNIQAVLIDTQQSAIEKLQQEKPDFAFIALHGVGGEDGTIQAVLESLEIPYSGSGILASALAMDKLKTKCLWRDAKLLTPKYTELNSQSDFEKIIHEFGKVVVKPSTEGSSLGMSVAETATDLKSAYEKASQYGGVIFAEQFISGNEYTVAVLGEKTLPAIRIETSRQFYDYDAKYIDNDTRFFVESGLQKNEENLIAGTSIAAFNVIACRDWGRVDFIKNDLDGKFYLLEVNTVPGLTDHSLVPMAAKSAGMDFADLIITIINLAMKNATH